MAEWMKKNLMHLKLKNDQITHKTTFRKELGRGHIENVLLLKVPPCGFSSCLYNTLTLTPRA